MLGEKLYELAGKVSGRRVLPGDSFGEVKVEVSFQGTGKILGINTIETGTYVAWVKAPGVLHGEGQGISITQDGEAVTWRGAAVGKPTGSGMAASWRGMIEYTTRSERLSRLNTTAVVFEWDVDQEGNARGSTFEWK